MQDELLNAAILLRRGSWVDPELFERAAKRMAELEQRIDSIGMELDVLQSFRNDDREALQAFREYDGDSGLWAAMKGQRDAALTRVAKLEACLRLIADFNNDCGCVPCTGQCRSKEALEIVIENMVDSAREAIAESAR